VKRFAALVLALSLVSGPLSAAAQNRGGGQGARSAPATRPASGGQAGGFRLNSDVQAGRAAQRPAQPPAQANRAANPPGNVNPGYRTPGSSGYRPPAAPPSSWSRPSGSNSYGYYAGYHGARAVVVNPYYYRGPAWGWNRGVIWYPAATYWGGGFWGALAIGVAAAAVFGAIVSSDQQTITSYQVAPDSPGATLLINFQLQQVPCGPPNLVVIFGPDNSVICANPNNLVAPGEYDLDAQQLSLVSR
jgi:hypothetical protein